MALPPPPAVGDPGRGSAGILGNMGRLGHAAGSILLGLALGIPAGAVAGETGGASREGVRITYLANEGFLLEAGEAAVLVDALFGDGLAEYPSVPRGARADLEGARGRFAGVDLILVSHAHADHFDAAAAARHLRANPGAALLSTPEVVAAVRDELGAAAAGREIVSVYPESGVSELHRAGGVEVRVLNLSHGPLPIQNLGLVVRLGGLEVLHVGDTSAAAAELQPYAAELAAADVWLLPDWLMGEPDWEAARGRAEGPTWLVDMHLAAQE